MALSHIRLYLPGVLCGMLKVIDSSATLALVETTSHTRPKGDQNV